MRIVNGQSNLVKTNYTNSQKTSFKATFSQIEAGIKKEGNIDSVAKELSLNSESIKKFLTGYLKCLKEISGNLTKNFDYKLGKNNFIPHDISDSYLDVDSLSRFDNDFNEGGICLGPNKYISGIDTYSKLFKLFLEKLNIENPDFIELHK